MTKRMQDWADTEDHDFLNEFVGQRIDRVETGSDGRPWLEVHTNRGRVLRVVAELDDDDAVLQIEEP